MRKMDNFWDREDKELMRKKKDNLYFFVERECFKKFLNMCAKTLNDNYFQMEGVYFNKLWVGRQDVLLHLIVENYLLILSLIPELN